MKSVLTLFMLMVFAMFMSVDNAEATLSLDGETFLTQLEEEAVSLAPNGVVLEYAAVQEAETVSIVLKRPYWDYASPGLDVRPSTDREFSMTEERSGGIGILSGGASRLI